MPLTRKEPPGSAGTQAQAAAPARLSAENPDERWAAAREMAARPGGVGALSAALATEGDPRVRAAMFTSLVRLGTAEAAAAVLPHLRSDDANLRTGALDALRAMPDAVASRLPELLGDADPDVRILACELVRHRPPAEASLLLADVLTREPEVNVCASAVDVLAELGRAEALPALAACARRFPHETFLLFAIKVAIERSGAPPRG